MELILCLWWCIELFLRMYLVIFTVMVIGEVLVISVAWRHVISLLVSQSTTFSSTFPIRNRAWFYADGAVQTSWHHCKQESVKISEPKETSVQSCHRISCYHDLATIVLGTWFGTCMAIMVTRCPSSQSRDVTALFGDGADLRAKWCSDHEHGT